MRRFKRDMSRLLNNKNKNSEIKASSIGLEDHEAIKLVEELKNHPEVTSLDSWLQWFNRPNRRSSQPK